MTGKRYGREFKYEAVKLVESGTVSPFKTVIESLVELIDAEVGPFWKPITKIGDLDIVWGDAPRRGTSWKPSYDRQDDRKPILRGGSPGSLRFLGGKDESSQRGDRILFRSGRHRTPPRVVSGGHQPELPLPFGAGCEAA